MEWIRINDVPPENEKEALFVIDGKIEFGYYDETILGGSLVVANTEGESYLLDLEAATHWMPLAEPPD